jgi:hypothetical protein
MAKLAAAALFWIAVGSIQEFNWQRGVYKALVLLAVLLAVPVILRAAARRIAAVADPSRGLIVATGALLAVHVGYAAKEMRHPSLIDAATTTLTAGEQLLGGGNPYASNLDAAAVGATQDPRFSGYKYLPMTLAAYLPLGAPLGERGLVMTNLLLHLAVVWLVFHLSRTLATAEAGWIAALVYLTLPLVPYQLFAKGATDLVAVLPLLVALPLIERRPMLAGIAIGLSLSAKLLPGLLVLPCCVPAATAARCRYGAGVVLGLAPTLPFLLWSPTAVFDNIVGFNFVRPVDSTSWLAFAPALASTLAHVVVALAILAAAIYVWRKRPSLTLRCGIAAVLILVAILGGPAAHHNYQLWWLPLLAALLAVVLAPNRLPNAGVAVYESGDRSA